MACCDRDIASTAATQDSASTKSSSSDSHNTHITDFLGHEASSLEPSTRPGPRLMLHSQKLYEIPRRKGMRRAIPPELFLCPSGTSFAIEQLVHEVADQSRDTETLEDFMRKPEVAKPVEVEEVDDTSSSERRESDIDLEGISNTPDTEYSEELEPQASTTKKSDDFTASSSSLDSGIIVLSTKQKVLLALRKQFPRTHRLLAAAKSDSSTTKDECLACTSLVPSHDIVCLPDCNHKYCTSCFNTLVQLGSQNEQSFPPRCCRGRIEASTIAQNASRKTIDAFNRTQNLMSIPPSQRWFCPYSKCGACFDITRARVHVKGVVCRRCQKKICVTCRQPAHKDSSKCNDWGVKETLLLVRKEHWRPCPRCGLTISINGGCRHIKCLCGANFCYVCGSKWRYCRFSGAECSRILYEATQREHDLETARRRLETDTEQRTRLAREETDAFDAVIHEAFEIARQATAVPGMQKTLDAMDERYFAASREHDDVQRRHTISGLSDRYWRDLRAVFEHQKSIMQARHADELEQPGPSSLPMEHEAEIRWLANLMIRRNMRLSEEGQLLLRDQGGERPRDGEYIGNVRQTASEAAMAVLARRAREEEERMRKRGQFSPSAQSRWEGVMEREEQKRKEEKEYEPSTIEGWELEMEKRKRRAFAAASAMTWPKSDEPKITA